MADPDLLAALAQLSPHWHAVAAIAFAAGNCPDAVPRVLDHVLAPLADHAERIAAARSIRDALFKAAMICGIPRIINALVALHDATPPDLCDHATLRPETSVEELVRAGRAFFDQTYGDSAEATERLLHDIYPDLGYFTTAFGYGYTYAFMGATSPMETSFAMIAALIAIDSPRQITWHLQGAMRNGATRDQVRAVREIAIRVSRAAGVVWRNDIPDLD